MLLAKVNGDGKSDGIRFQIKSKASLLDMISFQIWVLLIITWKFKKISN